jgi:hypothetical protein
LSMSGEIQAFRTEKLPHSSSACTTGQQTVVPQEVVTNWGYRGGRAMARRWGLRNLLDFRSGKLPKKIAKNYVFHLQSQRLLAEDERNRNKHGLKIGKLANHEKIHAHDLCLGGQAAPAEKIALHVEV